MNRRSLLAALVIALAPPSLIAQPLLLPGSTELVTTHLRDTESNVRYVTRVASGDTSEREVGRARVVERATTHQGAPAFLFINDIRFGGRTYLDSAVVRRADLVPVWESSYNVGRTKRYTYDGKRVSITVPDSAARDTTHVYDVPVFHFNELDALVRSLPLREGYERVVPLYSEGSDALEMDTVRVVRRASDGVWSIRFADPAIVATYGVDERTREAVSYSRVLRRDGSVMRKVRDP